MSHKLKCGLPFGRIDHDLHMTDNQSAVNFINNIFFSFYRKLLTSKFLSLKELKMVSELLKIT